MKIIKTCGFYCSYLILIPSLIALDLIAFQTFNQLIIQSLLSAYLIEISKSRPIISLIFIAALALESLIFFSHVSYGLFIALFLIPLTIILKAWIQTAIIANLISLGIAFIIQQLFLAVNQQLIIIPLLHFIRLFCVNGVFLCIYQFFDKNGKQGSRS